MNREDRAKQFMPFDALKGLQKALRLKEYEHEKKYKGDLSEEKIQEISKNLLLIDKNKEIILEYYEDGYIIKYEGSAKVEFSSYKLITAVREIDFDDILDLKVK